ncbi:hypothetical protein HPP92_022832 [Vanilla planifolia]|uniref:Uncharacterized protein n=1 Tax=Vanilla planifolia TaxID=51239 RepID=A0A835PY61_VANPL|nr:hypothetical protein HPP92_022832 [Vanilla planifolia]
MPRPAFALLFHGGLGNGGGLHKNPLLQQSFDRWNERRRDRSGFGLLGDFVNLRKSFNDKNIGKDLLRMQSVIPIWKA